MMLFTAAAANMEHKMTNSSRMMFMVFLRFRSFFNILQNSVVTRIIKSRNRHWAK